MRIPKDKWPEIIRQCKASGLSDWEWCRRNNIPDSTFYYQLDYAAYIKDFAQDMQGAVIKAEIVVPEKSMITAEAEAANIPHESMEYIRLLLKDAMPFMEFMTGNDYVPYYVAMPDEIRMIKAQLKDK